jgi:hypothetical protein
MSARRYPARWASIRRARRAGRCRRAVVRRGSWSGAEDWAHGLDLAGEVFARCAGASEPRLGARAREQASPAFVELFPSFPAGPSQCTIEISDPSGRKLTVSVRGAPGPELVAFTQAVWRGLR